ncbi:GGDEF domain-containing protein [bacterium]|nr:GGDEF domain-containing protein [bacterium]
MNYAQKIKELEDEVSRLRQIAEKDGLTGCLRREALLNILERRRKFGLLPKKLSLAIIDIDHFKNINDTHGHLAGDHVLKSVAQYLLMKVPSGSLVCRMGGEEFVLLIPSHLTNSFTDVDRLRRDLASNKIELENGVELEVTFSAGITEWDSDQPLLDATAEADAALYAAKRNGRNQITRAWRKIN